MMATAMPISPARTPRRAVRGWLSHFRERMNRAAATRYEAIPSPELMASADESGSAGTSVAARRNVLITAVRLPAEHFQHAVGNPEAADDVRRGGHHGQCAKHGVKGRVTFGHDLNRRDH